jgi:hypothetical protein
MSGLVRGLIVAGISIVLIVCVTAFILYRVHTGIVESVEHKSAKSSFATVVSVAEIGNSSPPEKPSADDVLKVCFTIDGFDQVESDMREGYQSAENQRLASDGPRCKVTAKVALAKNLNKGDKLSVVYLLENEYRIDIVMVTSNGEDL